MLILFLLCILFFAISVSQSNSSEIEDSFNNDSLNTDIWCPCQIKKKGKSKYRLSFPAKSGDGSDRYLRIMADEASLGGDVCRTRPPFEECTFAPLTEGLAAAVAPRPLTVDDLLELLADEDDDTDPLGPTVSPSDDGLRAAVP